MAWFAGTLVITTKNLCSFFVNFMPSDVFNGPTHCLKMTVFTRKRPWKIVTTKRTSVLDRFREGAFLANFRARRLILVSRGNVCFGHWWTYITHIQYTRWFHCWDIFARNIDTGKYILGEYRQLLKRSLYNFTRRIWFHKLVTVDEIKYWILANCLQYCCITINNLTESPIIVGKN